MYFFLLKKKKNLSKAIGNDIAKQVCIWVFMWAVLSKKVCAKCVDLHHPTHVQSLILGIYSPLIHSTASKELGSGQ